MSSITQEETIELEVMERYDRLRDSPASCSWIPTGVGRSGEPTYCPQPPGFSEWGFYWLTLGYQWDSVYGGRFWFLDGNRYSIDAVFFNILSTLIPVVLVALTIWGYKPRSARIARWIMILSAAYLLLGVIFYVWNLSYHNLCDVSFYLPLDFLPLGTLAFYSHGSQTVKVQDTSYANDSKSGKRSVMDRGKKSSVLPYDVFICYASEDKSMVAKPLAEALRKNGLTVWYDDFMLKLGDSLRRTIDNGLKDSRYGVVILSPWFFRKNWPQRELDGLVAKEGGREKVILPIWHQIGQKDVLEYSPTLADRLAVSTKDGLNVVVDAILEVIRTP